MTTRSFSRWMAVAGCVGAFAASVHAPVGAADGNKACGLLTPSELQTVLGTTVSLSGGGMAARGVALCTGQTSTATVMLRLSTGLDQKRDRSGGTEKKGIEVVKKKGIQVYVKAFGSITCSTMVPPENLAQHGFNTTCTVSKPTAVAGVEVIAKSQQDMVSIERLHPLAEKMAGRF
ncbi:MAG: hypothetical protein KGS09_11205 [Nitrospirae bacterium]|nr:hypothetical protein [Nitrospirota bacterium]